MNSISPLVSSIRKAVVGGMSAGGFGQFLASPTDLVKVQMQMEGQRVLQGKQPRYIACLENNLVIFFDLESYALFSLISLIFSHY